MEPDAKPVVDHQRRLNPKMKEVVRTKILKLLEVGIIYPIADSRWVSPVHCVPKKGGITVVPNDKNELIPQRIVTSYRMVIDFRKLNKATRKDHYCRGFITADVRRLRFEAIAKEVDSKGLNGTRDTSLPRFSPS